ncbi:uncharacterized protein SOCE26_079830 [Sorangium cellulosum]|uniref:Dickkopf N-terminal cysteine-rich domain-containing protein n=1 Tax=Sorangium cellulosum TaxID=56 RepID=A0A2L0F4M3_SORCE|nr:hypothetical protein [Sorangium cellulosum]AUX46477.1 uncharacterized protein SOCE26_079830 [Sorangium cellulosum]
MGKVADGGACTNDGDCSGEGSQCEDDVCTPPPAPSAEGEPCFFPEDCQEGLECDYVEVGLQCVKPQSKPDGQECAGNYDCASRYCDAMRVCAALREDGAECIFSGECKSGYCDTETFTCAPDEPAPEPAPEPADEEPVCDGT